MLLGGFVEEPVVSELSFFLWCFLAFLVLVVVVVVVVLPF